MSRAGTAVVLAACLSFPGPAPGADRAADEVTLRDGAVALGEVVEPSPRGPLLLLLRRDWARRHLPAWADRWEAAEAATGRLAAAQRRDRLAAWNRDRGKSGPGADDRIAAWIDRELDRLRPENAGAGRPTLLVASLNRSDVRAVRKTPPGTPRLLRLAWRLGLREPEGLTVADLSEALESRGIDTRARGAVNLDPFLPPQPETDAAWLVRRAATEVGVEPDLRFIRYGGLVLPEPPGGQPLNLGSAPMALSALKDLVGGSEADPLPARLGEVAARGRVGAVVTRLDVAPDFSAVAVEMTLWVRHGADRWVPSSSRTARVRPDELGDDAGDDLAADPQVATAFRVVESLGLGVVPPEVRKRSLGVGAATRKALGLARTAADADLAALALPVFDAPRAPQKPARP